MKVVIDTSLVVSGSISPTGAPARILRLWRENRFELLVSSPMLAEYREALSHDRVRKRHGLNLDEVRDAIEDFAKFGTLIAPTETTRAIPADPDDDIFFECTVAGDASIIVSGDPHLQMVGSYRGIRVLSPTDFLTLLRIQEVE